MAIGFWEVTFLITLFLGLIIISRTVTRLQTKRICPDCGFAIRTDTPTCPACQYNFLEGAKDNCRS